MQAKLTLRVEESLIRKAKQLARKRGTSVSRIFADFISTQNDELPSSELPLITSSMIGIIRKEGTEIDEKDYRKHLEEKHL